MTTTDDALHQEAAAGGTWSRANIAEAVPGVQTPLSWSIWGEGLERGIRGGYHDLGLVKAADVDVPADAQLRLFAIFYGRPAVNVGILMGLMGALVRGDAATEQWLGMSEPGGAARAQSRSATASIVGAAVRARTFARVTATSALLSGRIDRERADVLRWWQAATAARDWGQDEARRLFIEARERFTRVMRLHAAAVVMQPLYDWLGRVAVDAGHPGAEMNVLSGQGIDETRELERLWDVAHGRTTLERFLSEFGFHGPAEGELASRSWREDPAPLQALIERLAERGPEDSPAAHLERQRRDQALARSQVLAGSTVARRVGVRAVIPLARHFLQLRERGKSAFLLAFDGARCAARALGVELAAAGVLDDPDDVFYLTADEIASAELPANVEELVSQRRADRAAYEALELPDQWVGRPEPVTTADIEATEVTRLDAIGASPGVVEGLARVVVDPSSAEIEEGEILVCPHTDPSWATFIMLSAAVVIDIGGPLSHGAVVARELGVPCVINTRTGVKALRTGDRIRVDGGSGTVEILQRAGTSDG